jgi:hypothetical protein
MGTIAADRWRSDRGMMNSLAEALATSLTNAVAKRLWSAVLEGLPRVPGGRESLAARNLWNWKGIALRVRRSC